jgi:hypothetical protein
MKTKGPDIRRCRDQMCSTRQEIWQYFMPSPGPVIRLNFACPVLQEIIAVDTHTLTGEVGYGIFLDSQSHRCNQVIVNPHSEGGRSGRWRLRRSESRSLRAPALAPRPAYESCSPRSVVALLQP